MATRVLALVGAVAMVLIALAVRSGVDGGDNGNGGDDASGRLVLVCATELRAVCEELDDREDDVDVTIEAAAVTADRLQAATPDKAALDGWLAPGPWGEMVDAARLPNPGLFAATGRPLARSPFVLAVWKTSRAKLNCATPVELACVGDAVNARRFRLGIASDDQAEGVLADAALAAAHSKNANFATNDFTETDLADWLTTVDTNVDGVTRNPGARSFTELLTFGAASADGFLSTDAVIGPQLARAAKRGQLDVGEVRPGATADVLFAPRDSERGRSLGDIVRGERVRAALAANGWRVGAAAAAPRLPTDDGLPSAGVLQALRDLT